MPDAVSTRARVVVDGKFFRLGREKFCAKGVTYGPFPPNAAGEFFPTPEATARDFTQVRRLGANVLRVYGVPPRWFLDLALARDLRLLIDIPWNQHACFLDSAQTAEAARQAVRQAARACQRHPAVFALSVANEIPPDIVRWSGAAKVAEFVDELVATVKGVDPECLCSFGNYPPTEFLRPRECDFVCFNVYLHQPKAFQNYLARLQMLADNKPLVLGEFGLDSERETEARQAELLGWMIEGGFRAGVAGAFVYSFTDEWFKDGRLIADWHFGLTTRERQPKPAFRVVAARFQTAPHFPLPREPLVSVVVACYNGARTLKVCLEALARLDYPAYEVLLVDDGSTDTTPEIAAKFQRVQYVRQEHSGLGLARNTGLSAARGEIVAFTDADCRPDEDWLRYLVAELLADGFAGVGGHNLLPPDDSWVAAAVLVSPGGPAHVMLDDRVAEHIPGCNMAFWKWALLELGGFDPQFHQAGDDVDVCWRLQQRGYEIGFSPAGFVWHYRRSTVADYLKQQQGYGEGEALLERKHPEYFNPLGGSIWHGRIYTPAQVGLVARPPIIYHGVFASGMFQSLYTAAPSFTLMLAASLEYYVLVTLPLLVVGAVFRWLLPVALASLLVSLGVCVAAAAQAELPRRKHRFWSRPLVGLLFALQPLVRGWARYRGRLFLRHPPLEAFENLDSVGRKQRGQAPARASYLAPADFPRHRFLAAVVAQVEQRGWQNRPDTGWSHFDLEILGSRWCRLQLTTVSEFCPNHGQVLHCRLQPAWTLPARITLWSLAGVALLLIGLVGGGRGWWWLSLLLLPTFLWWQRRQQKDLQRLVGVLLDQVAESLGLTIPTPAAAPEEAKVPATRRPRLGLPEPAQAAVGEDPEGRGKPSAGPLATP